MPKTNVNTNLPAPLSLTLEEASKVAAGSLGPIAASVETWWWKGQPAYAFLNQINTVTAPATIGVGQIATH